MYLIIHFQSDLKFFYLNFLIKFIRRMQILKCSDPGNFIEYIGHDARVTKYPIPYSLKRQIGYLSYSGIMMDIL